MTDELGPNQHLLLWDLALRGGKALQKDVEYKEIAPDRKQLEHREFLKVSKQNRSFHLELTDGGWNELAKRRSIHLKSKRKPSRERAILQLLLDALQSYSSAQNVGVGELIRPTRRAPPSLDLQQEIRRAFAQIAGSPPQDSVRLSALRAQLSAIPRQHLDETLLAMKRAHQIQLISLDNPRDVRTEESASLRDGDHRYQALWIEP
jgi:hypothetical protein